MFRFISKLLKARKTFSPRTRLELESLERRDMPAVGILSAQAAAMLPVLAINAPPANPTLTWINHNIHDPTVLGLVQAVGADGTLTRNDMTSIFRGLSLSLSLHQTGISAMQLADLETILANPGVLGMPDYVHNLANKVVNANPANAMYQSGTLEQWPGLQPGDAAWMLTDLTEKWFYGTDNPQLPTDLTYTNGQPIVLHYQAAAGTLFGNGVSYQDVVQGGIGDCYLMAALEETALQSPQTITSMFLDNGDGTYTVRFYNAGAPDYVTVDKNLPADVNGMYIMANHGESISNTSNKLWVALAEKAYAELDAEGWNGRPSLQQTNTYDGLNAGKSTNTLPQITGFGASYGTLTGNNQLATFETAFSSDKLLVFNTGLSSPLPNLVTDHVYALISYFGNGVFILGNPWGINATVNGQAGGMLFLTPDQMVKDGFIGWVEVNMNPGVAPFQPTQQTPIAMDESRALTTSSSSQTSCPSLGNLGNDKITFVVRQDDKTDLNTTAVQTLGNRPLIVTTIQLAPVPFEVAAIKDIVNHLSPSGDVIATWFAGAALELLPV